MTRAAQADERNANDAQPHAARDEARGDGVRAVLEAAVEARDARDATLALVLETEGSTYAGTGAMALFDGARQVGWLSGGCLEPELARRASAAAADARIEWLEIDTREDEDLLSGSALGCRGRLRIALLPLRLMPGLDLLLDAWRGGGVALEIALRHQAAGHACQVSVGASKAATVPGDRGHGRSHTECPDEGLHHSWSIEAASPLAWHADTDAWTLRIAAPPEALLLGAGPETPRLLSLLRALGWRTTLVERRPRWTGAARDADAHLAQPPAQALRDAPAFDAALVMHHAFELDREALEALASTAIPFVGLLGPGRRRDDLFRVLPEAVHAALSPRLHAPVGLDLGGRGAEAIALSIAAQLQAWRHAGDRGG